MHSNKGFAGFDPIQERLFVGERQDTGCIGEDDAVIVFERGGGHLFGHICVITDVVHGEVAAFLAQFGQNLFSGRNRAVVEALGNGDNEQLFWGGLRGSSKAEQRQREDQDKKE